MIGALYRAMRLCSEVEEFEMERLDIELLLLLNGYPPRFVQYHMKRFLQRHQAITLIHEPNPAVYNAVHHRLLQQPTRRERSLGQEIGPEEDVNDAFLRRIKSSVTFENGFTLLFKRRLLELWKHHYHYPGSPLHRVTLLFVMHSNPSLNKLLVRKKPKREQLKHQNP